MHLFFITFAAAVFLIGVIVLGIKVNKLRSDLLAARRVSSERMQRLEAISEFVWGDGPSARAVLENEDEYNHIIVKAARWMKELEETLDTLNTARKEREELKVKLEVFDAFRTRVFVALGWSPFVNTTDDSVVDEVRRLKAVEKTAKDAATRSSRALVQIKDALDVPEGEPTLLHVMDFVRRKEHLEKELTKARNEVAALTLEKEERERGLKYAAEIVFELEKVLPEEVRGDRPIGEIPKLVSELIEENVNLSAALANSQPRDPKTGRLVAKGK
jgi:hypothetical protein